MARTTQRLPRAGARWGAMQLWLPAEGVAGTASVRRTAELWSCCRLGHECDVDVLALAVPQDREGHAVADIPLAHLGDQRQGTVDGVAVHGDDRVACLQSGLVRGSPADHIAQDGCGSLGGPVCHDAVLG